MVHRTVLSNGLIILYERVKEQRSFSCSITVKSGSAMEVGNINGIHHCIEHMIFKGTKVVNQQQIAEISDRLGGTLNAFTAREITQFYIKSIREKFNEALGLVHDMVLNSVFPEEEFSKEKTVVIQEINESIDQPDSYVFELFYRQLFPNSPLGFPIAGTAETVKGLEYDRVYSFYRKTYRPENMIISVVGDLGEDEVISKIYRLFSQKMENCPLKMKKIRGQFDFGTSLVDNKNLLQTYCVIGFKAIRAGSPLKYPYYIMNDILGAGMSSRLFQIIREQKGIAYNISSSVDTLQSTGVQVIHAVLDPDRVDLYLEAVKEVIFQMRKEGISPKELERSKDHLKSSFILSLENSNARMRFNVSQELYLEQKVTIDEIISMINRIGLSEVNRIIEEFLDLNTAKICLYGKAVKNKYRNLKF